MNVRFPVRMVQSLLAAAAVLALAGPALSMECGDVDASGNVSASDALAVLRRAVGIPGQSLQCPDQCPAVTTTTSSTTTNTSNDECFGDQDCVSLYGPGYVCDGPVSYQCVRCRSDEDCGAGSQCVDWDCVPSAP